MFKLYKVSKRKDLDISAAERTGQALVDIARHYLDHQALRSGSRHRPHVNVVVDIDDLVGRELSWKAAPGASVLCLPHPSGASTWLNDAGRVELCDNLAEGGTTPCAGDIAAARQLH